MFNIKCASFIPEWTKLQTLHEGQKYHVDGPVDGVFDSQKEKRLLDRVNKIRPCKKTTNDHSLQTVA